MSQREITKHIWIYFKLNKNENTYQNVWDAAKAGLRGKFIAYFKRFYEKRKMQYQIKGNNKDKSINETEKGQNIEKLTKSRFSKMSNKIDKPLSRSIKEKRENTHF